MRVACPPLPATGYLSHVVIPPPPLSRSLCRAFPCPNPDRLPYNKMQCYPARREGGRFLSLTEGHTERDTSTWDALVDMFHRVRVGGLMGGVWGFL